MIGVFDSGLGGIAIVRELAGAGFDTGFAYLGDHAGPPYGSAPSDQIVERTRRGVEALFERGCHLVIVASNTATAVALSRLQRRWLPGAGWKGCNVLGVIVPCVEVALARLQPPPAQFRDSGTHGGTLSVVHTAPRFVAVIGATRTITSGVYRQEFRKRAPKVQVAEQISFNLASAIEDDASEAELRAHVKNACAALMQQLRGAEPEVAILASSSFDLVADTFAENLPAATRVIHTRQAVAEKLAAYLDLYPHYADHCLRNARQAEGGALEFFTTGDAAEVTHRAQALWPDLPAFRHQPLV